MWEEQQQQQEKGEKGEEEEVDDNVGEENTGPRFRYVL